MTDRYLAQDRRRALAAHTDLAERTTGSALFVDISGFTPLTEILHASLGARQGAEVLSHALDSVYSALIEEVERYTGSVISFAGDAMLCWFDDADGYASLRAATCGVALQRTMQQFETFPLPNGQTTMLGIKVAIATGAAQRIVVGDPRIHGIDTLVGTTIARTAHAEQVAHSGEIVVDHTTLESLGDAVIIRAWRTHHAHHEPFAILDQLTSAAQPLPIAQPPDLDSAQLQAWIHPSIYLRETTRQTAFLTELRPTVAMFIRFDGINYDQDGARAQLDQVIRCIQGVLALLSGMVLQLVIGDKGSYLYASFGALRTHEDDARRAVKAALEIRSQLAQLSFLQPIQIGISQGVMRVGTYGGTTRRTYSALGDDVNLAARLMQLAAPGEILISGALHQTVSVNVSVNPRPPLTVKGKTEPMTVFAVIGERQQRAIRLQEPTYELPMVGRQDELRVINATLDAAIAGRAQVVGIIGEAGMGKSRLAAEVIRLAHQKGFTGYAGTCPSDGTQTPYLVWKPILSAMFDRNPAAPLRRQLRTLEEEIADRIPHRSPTIPLLGTLFDLAIPDNDVTRTLDAHNRKMALHALLEDYFKAVAREEPLLIVVEDMHWIDSLSHDLLDELARATTHLPICYLLVYRPPHMLRLKAPRLETLPNFTRIVLGELTPHQSEQAVRAKLTQLYAANTESVPQLLFQKLYERAQGNPFYLEELLNYVHDRRLDPYNPAHLQAMELPNSIHTLILSRIDQLSEREQLTLRVASIIGRLFRAAWLVGYYPALGSWERVTSDLDSLDALDLTLRVPAETAGSYLFKHIVTHEVTYESLPYTLRAQLHEQLAHYLERTLSDSPPLETLAFHYSRSENRPKQREYVRKAAEAAQRAYANDAALSYYEQLIPLLDSDEERMTIAMQRGAVYELLGAWDAAEAEYQAAEALAADQQGIAEAHLSLGKLATLQSKYDHALERFSAAQGIYAGQHNEHGLAHVAIAEGIVWHRKGEFARAQTCWEVALAHGYAIEDSAIIAQSMNNLGNVAVRQGNYPTARQHYDASHAIWQSLGDMYGISKALHNLGVVVLKQGHYAEAWNYYEASLAIQRTIGDKNGIANSLNDLALAAANQGEFSQARTLLEESLALMRELGQPQGVATALNNLGSIAADIGDYETARIYTEESLAIRRSFSDNFGVASSLNNLGNICTKQGDDTAAAAHFAESTLLALRIGDSEGIAYNAAGMGIVMMHRGDIERTIMFIAAAQTLMTAIEGAFEPALISELDGVIAKAHSAVGEQAFQQAWNHGEKLSLDDVVQAITVP